MTQCRLGTHSMKAAAFQLALGLSLALTAAGDAHAQDKRITFRIEIDGLQLRPFEFEMDTAVYHGFQSEVAAGCQKESQCIQQLTFTIFADRPVTRKIKLFVTLVALGKEDEDVIEPPTKWEASLLAHGDSAQAWTHWDKTKLKNRAPGLLRVAVRTDSTRKPAAVSEQVVYFCSAVASGGFRECFP